MWAMDAMNEVAVGLVLPVLYIVLCGVKQQVVYSPWLSEVPIIVIGGFALGKILQETGLGKRIGLACVRCMGGSFVGTLIGITLAVSIVAPLVGLVMAVALVANLGQVGILFAFKGAMPKLENISPSKWFQKVFSMKNLVEFLKNIIKVTVLGVTVWVVMRDHLPTLFAIQRGTIWTLWEVLGLALKDLLLMAAGVFCVIAAVDYLFQKWQYAKNHMMSKDEVKREYKEMEGDPQVKGKRKQLHQEMLSQNALGNVRKAKVLVTNPTHYAVALDYEKDRTPLPVILAKGEGFLAQRMIRVAQEEGIPIMRNVPLARSLFENGTENAYIPKDLIGPVAEVLRWVQSLQRQ